MIVEASKLQPGDRFAGRVVVEIDDYGHAPWAVTVRHRGPGEIAGPAVSLFPKGMLLDIERPQKRWRRVVTQETADESLAASWRSVNGKSSTFGSMTSVCGPVEVIES